MQPFLDYIITSRQLVASRRTDLYSSKYDAERIITLNTPFEFKPTSLQPGQKVKFGALLIHGLLDSPFTMHDIGSQLAEMGILARAILLPGHGTTSSDLLNASQLDWIKTVEYGIASLQQDVDHVILIGYSTGATLSLYHALQRADVAGMVLLAPALKINAPINMLIQAKKLMKLLNKKIAWVNHFEEHNIAKYQSVALRAVIELGKLMRQVRILSRHQTISCPSLMIISREDETISSKAAIKYFKSTCNNASELLLYSSKPENSDDHRIQIRHSPLNQQHIKHLSHLALPHSPQNSYYGLLGDYRLASSPERQNAIYGAYNFLEMKLINILLKLGVIKNHRYTLSYNPDFDYMMQRIRKFILKLK